MSSSVEVVSVNLSQEKGVSKRPAGRAQIDRQGLVGDAHAGTWHRQVSLLDQAAIDRFAVRTGRAVRPGEFAENLTVRGLDLGEVAVLDRFQFGPVELEVTQIGKECHGNGCAIFQQVGQCVMPAEGIFARVLHGGQIADGDRGQWLARPLRLVIITLSDRASAGHYPDRSGPRCRELVESFLAGRRWHPVIESALLPDDAPRLAARLRAEIDSGADVIFTTGSTGIGPRDIAPETVAAACQRLLPGITEHLRAKFGGDKPLARLSRAVAGVARTTQLYTLPGSVRAVEEYLGEIFQTLEHAIFMLHGLDVHG
jgi:molybdenum cofactor synthesis domain-containing protein